MNLSAKQRLAAFLGLLCFTAGLGGCSYFKKNESTSLNTQESDSVSAIERQQASGEMTAMEAAIEKDAVTPSHSLKF